MSKVKDQERTTIRELVVSFKGPKRTIEELRITSSRVVASFFRQKLRVHLEPTEFFYLLILNAKNEVLGYQMVSKGGSSTCPVAPVDVFRIAMLSGASGIIAIHNHPSGDSTPSPDDIALTERLEKAANVLGIRLVDHVIIGDPEYFSFLDAGLLQKKESP